MKKTLKLLSLVLFTVIILSHIPSNSFASKEINEDIRVVVDGKYLGLKGFKKGNITYVKLRGLAEELEYKIEYDSKTKTAKLNKNNEIIKIKVNSNIIEKNNKINKTKNKNILINNNIYIPIRDFGEIINKKIDWNEDNKIVIFGEYNSGREIKDSHYYINESYQYALKIPNYWKNKDIVIEENFNGPAFYHKDIVNSFMKEYKTKGGPIFQIRTNAEPVIGQFPSDNIILLDYDGFRFTEALFDDDFQFTKETADIYKKIQKEGKNVIETYKNIETIKADSKKYNEELKIARDIRDNYTVKNIFDNDEIYTKNIQFKDDKFFYMRNQVNDKYGPTVKLKIEMTLDENNKLKNYHLKSYGDLYDYYEKNSPKKLSTNEIDKNTKEFVKKFITDKSFKLEKYIYKDYENLIRYNEKDLKISIFVDGETGLIYAVRNEIWNNNIEIPSIF